jgi:hypothetical protein
MTGTARHLKNAKGTPTYRENEADGRLVPLSREDRFTAKPHHDGCRHGRRSSPCHAYA